MGLGGLEPPASPLSGVRSDRLSYRPLSPEAKDQAAERPKGALAAGLGAGSEHVEGFVKVAARLVVRRIHILRVPVVEASPANRVGPSRPVRSRTGIPEPACPRASRNQDRQAGLDCRRSLERR